MLEASQRLAAVMLCCIGDDSVDKEACAQRGVLVTNDPVSNGRSVAELVIGELIMLSRRVFDSVREMDQSVWKKNNQARYELLNKRLGVIGLGNIGRQVAQLGKALGMEIYFYDNAQLPTEVGQTMGYNGCDSVKQVFEACDFVTVHVGAADLNGRSNKNLFDYDTFKGFGQRPETNPRIFLNLSRGFLFPPEDLIRAVNDGFVTYAMTDVFPEEPRSSATAEWDNPYADTPQIFGTPHIGAATMEAQPRIGRYVARTTQLLSDFGMLRNCVFRPRAKTAFEVPEGATHMLAVVHADKRGTKKAVVDAIFNAGANNLRSSHIDFPRYGVAYEVAAIEGDLSAPDLAGLVKTAADITGDPAAIRWLRTIPLS